MAGQAAGKSRSTVTSAMNSLDISHQKKTGTGSDPVMHPNVHGNPSLNSDGSIFGKTKKIKIQNYC